jgi:hypothetical protein
MKVGRQMISLGISAELNNSDFVEKETGVEDSTNKTNLLPQNASGIPATNNGKEVIER